MNKIILALLRAAALAAALVILPVPGRAGGPPNQTADKASRTMDLTGWVELEKVADMQIGSTIKAAAGELGPADRVLSDGTWLIYKDFHVDHSAAHGVLAVSLKDGRVSAMRLLSAAVAVDLATRRGNTLEKVLVASNR